MTCIAAVPTPEGGVVVGGDSAGVSGYSLTTRADEKVFRRGPFVMGFTSSFRMGQLLRYSLKVPTHPPMMPDEEYMATRFVDAVRKCLDDGGWRKKESDRERGGTFLAGYRGCVYQVGGDFQVGVPRRGYDAVGCGADLALGALHATEGTGRPAEERVFAALGAAEAFSAGVRGPFVVLDSEGGLA